MTQVEPSDVVNTWPYPTTMHEVVVAQEMSAKGSIPVNWVVCQVSRFFVDRMSLPVAFKPAMKQVVVAGHEREEKLPGPSMTTDQVWPPSSDWIRASDCASSLKKSPTASAKQSASLTQVTAVTSRAPATVGVAVHVP